MSSPGARKKRNSNDGPAPAPEGDHRKRRRNRTTQSCLNCHTSKRMCDRKRPCGRCTQLGLTGLCVYEVDDPSQRSETLDESSRLRGRVAELEGVIRELKNKPHPRWVQSGCNPGEEFEKWHSRSQNRGSNEVPLTGRGGSHMPTPPRTSSPSEKGENSSASRRNSTASSSASTAYPSPITPQFPENPGHRFSHPHDGYLNNPSPLSSCTLTPPEDFSQPFVSIASHQDDFDLTSILMSYPGLMSCDDGIFGQYEPLIKDDPRDESCFSHRLVGHCGCLNNFLSYNVVLELSRSLRKAADIYSRFDSHRLASGCLLNQRISELSTITTNALQTTASPLEITSTLSLQDVSQLNHPAANHISIPDAYESEDGKSSLTSLNMLPQAMDSIRAWDLMTTAADGCDDSFVSWEPQRCP